MKNYKILKMKPDQKKVMTIKEFCKEYGIGENKARQLIHSEGFPAVFNGNRAIIIRSKIDEFFENQIGKTF
jgi:excisionase family DNA binding protein